MTSLVDQRLKTKKGTLGSGGRPFLPLRPCAQDDQTYCIICRLQPWQDIGEPAVAYVTIERKTAGSSES